MVYPTVTNTVIDASGRPVVGAYIGIALTGAAAFSSDVNNEILSGTTFVTTDSTGTWTAVLKPNSLILTAGTYYTITEPGGAVWTAVVPNGAGPYWLNNILTVSPAAPAASLGIVRYDTAQPLTTSQQTQAQQNANAAPSGLPAYSGAVRNRFDPTGSVYNAKPSNTSRIASAIARVAAGTGSGEFMFMGDSLPAGSTLANGTYQVTAGWPSFMRTLNNWLPQASQADGFIRTVSSPVGAVGSATASDPRWAFTGTWTNFTSFANSTAVNSTATLTTTNTGTNCSVWYYDYADSSTFTISVNGAVSGAGFATVTSSGPAGWKRKDLTGFTAANNVQVKQTAGANMAVSGAILWSSNTLMFHNVAQGGSTATGTGANSWTDTAIASAGGVYVAPHKVAVTQTDPDAVFIALGANDMKTLAASAVTPSITAIANAYPNSDIVLVGEQPLNTTYFSDATWTGYVAALYALADTRDTPLADQRNIAGTYANAVTRGYTVDGQGHFLPFGNAVLGRAMARGLI